MASGFRTRLAYGDTVQEAALPPHWNVVPLAFPARSADRDERDVLLEALHNPVGSPPLSEFLKGAKQLLILVPDKTRLCRLHSMLPILLEEVHRCGMTKASVALLFANGTHSAMTADEQRSLLGEDVYASYSIYQHNARDEEGCVEVGTTRFGTRVLLNRMVAEHDRVLVAGTIVHHYFAGYGGGAKMFFPGIAAYSTAAQNHRRCLDDEGNFISACRDGNVEGNPVAEDIWDAVRFFPPTFSVAAILSPENRIAAAAAGDLTEAQRKGSALIDTLYATKVSSPSDVTVVSPGGYPKDINLIQSHKTLHRAQAVTRKGGVIIFVAECREGVGNPAFERWLEYSSLDALKKAVIAEYAMNAHTAIALRQKAESHVVIMVSALPDDVVRRLGYIPASTLAEAVATAQQFAASHPIAYVYDRGSLLLPLPAF